MPRKDTIPPVDRLMAKVIKTPECWTWTGALNRQGYGRIGVGQKVYLTHRLAIEIALGRPIPEGLLGLHTCDNPPCMRNDDIGTYIVRGIAHIRVGHIWLGTLSDNMMDMVDKGRMSRVTHRLGENNNAARLTESQVVSIRERYDPDRDSQRKLASEFGVSRVTIRNIVTRRQWQHIE